MLADLNTLKYLEVVVVVVEIRVLQQVEFGEGQEEKAVDHAADEHLIVTEETELVAAQQQLRLVLAVAALVSKQIIKQILQDVRKRDFKIR